MKQETPYLFIDEEIMENNINRMAKKIKALNCKLRPHVKTHKNIEIAKRQISAGAVGITVAKLGEAEIMASGGIKDIFIAYPLIGENKIKRAIELSYNVERLILSTDSIEGARQLSKAAVKAGTILEVRIEVDTGLKRTGVPLKRVKAFAKEMLEMPGFNATGLFTFKGAIYNSLPTNNYKLAGREEGEMLLALKQELAPLGDFELSGGSTPTGIYTAQVQGVDEIRPGTYVFNDAMQVATGRCDVKDCAVKVIYTIISIHEDGRMIIDGGSKSISTDIVPNSAPYNLEGYGICFEDEHIVLDRLSEEHGMIKINEGAGDYKIGDTISFIPNHVCTTVNLYDTAYMGNNENHKIIKIDARGKLR